MNYREQVESLIAVTDGIVMTKAVEDKGILRHYLTVFTREGKFERAAHGADATADAFVDDLYILQMKGSTVVFFHEASLFSHDLTDRDPFEWSVTVLHGYNGTKLREEGISVYSVKKPLHLMGITEVETVFGRKVTVYNKERTICDIIRNRNNMDIAILNEGIKRYLGSKDKNISLLLSYAKELRVQKIARRYMEILL